MIDWRAVAHEHYPESLWTDEDQSDAQARTAELDALGVRHSPVAEWDRGPYQPLRAYGIELPALVVATRVEFAENPVSLPSEREWLAVEHFSTGFACFHDRLVVTVLRPRPEIAAGMAELSQAYFGSNIEHPDLDQTVEYRSRLRELLGADCATVYPGWSEACYPIDLEYLTTLTDEVVELPSSEEVGLYVLAENSDIPPEWLSSPEQSDEQVDCSVEPEADPTGQTVRHGQDGDYFLPFSAYGLSTPVLALATTSHLSPGQRINAERDWYAVKHGHLELIATVLEPRPEVTEALATLANEYAGHVYDETVPLDELLAYRTRLQELLGADCTAGFGLFDTGICRIDADHVETLTGQPLGAYVTALPGYQLNDWKVLLLLPLP